MTKSSSKVKLVLKVDISRCGLGFEGYLTVPYLTLPYLVRFGDPSAGGYWLDPFVKYFTLPFSLLYCKVNTLKVPYLPYLTLPYFTLTFELEVKA